MKYVWTVKYREQVSERVGGGPWKSARWLDAERNLTVIGRKDPREVVDKAERKILGRTETCVSEGKKVSEKVVGVLFLSVAMEASVGIG